MSFDYDPQLKKFFYTNTCIKLKQKFEEKILTQITFFPSYSNFFFEAYYHQLIWFHNA